MWGTRTMKERIRWSKPSRPGNFSTWRSKSRAPCQKTAIWPCLVKLAGEVSNSETGRIVHESYPRGHTRRLQGDFYVNEFVTGHGPCGVHQARFFSRKPHICLRGRQKYDQPYILRVRSTAGTVSPPPRSSRLEHFAICV